MTAVTSRRSPSPSASDSSGDSPITYVEEQSAPTLASAERITTTRKKDWREKSDWWMKPRSEMAWHEIICSRAQSPEETYYVVPNADRGPIPTLNVWHEHVFILRTALLPLAIQVLSYYFFPQYKWHIVPAFVFYLTCFAFHMFNILWRLSEQTLKYGTFDEANSGRDRIPNSATKQLARAFILTPGVRTFGAFALLYNASENPLDAFSWTFPIRMGLFMISVDYFFYAYHRTTHEVDFFWQIHQRHHSTKHPSPALSIIADDIQELIEIAIVPFFALLVVPMTFHELYVTLSYCIFTETGGHSGMRVATGHPVLHWLLEPLGMALIIEDHDLHHRNGKSGRSYGKHTQVFDKIFGTKGTRIETAHL